MSVPPSDHALAAAVVELLAANPAALARLRELVQPRVQAAGKRGVSERLAADLVGLGYVDLVRCGGPIRALGAGAINAINTLVELGILSAASSRTRKGAQLYVAAEVVRTISE